MRCGGVRRAGRGGVRRPGGTRRRLVGLLTGVVALAGVLAACSGDDAERADVTMTASDDAGGPAVERDTVETEGSAPATPPAAGEQAGEGQDVAAPASATFGRRVIRTAELVLEVDDPAAVADEVVTIASDAGGFVATTDLTRDEEGVVRGTIVLRVPSAALVPTVDALEALAASVPVNRIDEVDVTAESTDLAAQLTNLTAYEGELRQLLADVRETTTRPDDLLTVFERVRSVREEIDRIEARLALLDDQVALSTIAVTLRPAVRALPVSDPTWQPGGTAREALTALSRTMTGIADAAIWIVLAVVPVLLVIAIPLVVAGLGWRAHRRRHPRPTTPTPPGAGTPVWAGAAAGHGTDAPSEPTTPDDER
jgi:hypothetical protein